MAFKFPPPPAAKPINKSRHIGSFTQRTCTELQDRVMELLKPLEAEYGIALKQGRGAIGQEGTYFIMKIEAALVTAGGEVLSKEATAFKQYAILYDLKPEWLGQTFVSDDAQRHTITGLRTRAPKAPVLTTANGKTYVWPSRSIIRHMEGAR
jgi:hypothetical protein